MRIANLFLKNKTRFARDEFNGFSLHDKWLWASGQTWKTPEIIKVADLSGFNVFRVQDIEIVWPQNYSARGLGWIYSEIFSLGWQNPHAYEIGECRILPGEWVIDVGACEGFFSIYAAKKGANVIAIEPVPLFAQALGLTINRLALSKMITAKNCLAADTDGTGLIYAEKNHPDQANSVEGEEKFAVETKRIDSIFQEKGFPRIDFLKIDVEGTEVLVLRGAQEVIKKFKPRIGVAVYHHNMQAKEVRDVIFSIAEGYKIWTRGLFLEENGSHPRPMMLYAVPKSYQ